MFCLPSTTSAVHFPWPTHTRTRLATRALRVCGWALPHSGADTDLAPGVGLDSVRRPRRREFRKALHPGSRPRREASDGSPTSLRGWSPGPTAHVCRDPSIGALMLGRGSAALDAATPDGSHRPAALSGPTRDDDAGRVLEWPEALRSRRRKAPRRHGVGVYSKGVTGVNVLPQLRLRGQASAPNPPGGIGMTVAAEVPEQPSNEKWALAGQPKVS